MNTRKHQVGVSRPLVLLLALITLIAVPLSSPAVVEGASLKHQIEAAKKRQANLSKSIEKSQQLVTGLKRDESSTRTALAGTKRDLDDTRTDQRAVKRKIEQAEARLERIEERHAELVEELRQSDWTLGLLEQELASGETDLKARRQALGQRLAEAYRAENATLLEQVFTAESFSDALTETSAYLAYGEQESQLALQIGEDQQALDTLRLLTTGTRLLTDQIRRDTIETRIRVEELRKSLREAKRRLARLEKQQSRLLEQQRVRLASIYKNKKALNRAIQQQVAQRTKLRNSIASKLARMNRVATAKFGVRAGSGGGRFAWPTTGNISQNYGCSGYGANPPRGSCPNFHDGIDIANGSGTAIQAAADGIVTYVGFNRWEAVPAYIIIIAHGGGVSTLYAHMQPVKLVSVGQTVKKGQKIALMGSSGLSSGSHLHFEVWAGGDWAPVNPYAYL